VAGRRPSPAMIWWLAAGVAELTIAILLLANGYWYTIFGTAPATAACVYFVLRERNRQHQ
jgi:Flp pilus assembly protein TadB